VKSGGYRTENYGMLNMLHINFVSPGDML